MVRVVLALSAAALLFGCGSKLDDGYEPRKLGVSPEVRRSYYADPFTPEATPSQDNSGTPVSNSHN